MKLYVFPAFYNKLPQKMLYILHLLQIPPFLKGYLSQKKTIKLQEYHEFGLLKSLFRFVI
jgi:hypothetical protein